MELEQIKLSNWACGVKLAYSYDKLPKPLQKRMTDYV